MLIISKRHLLLILIQSMELRLIASSPTITIPEINSRFKNLASEPGVDLIEGDMVAPGDLVPRNGIRGEEYRWLDGRIPFVFDASITSARDRDGIQRQLDYFNSLTCVKFVPKKDTDLNYVTFQQKSPGCYSYVGRIGGNQAINMPNWCILNKGVSHEAMHAAGFFHEQSRADRDQYLIIYMENVSPEARINLQIQPSSYAYEFPYDYESIMHYPANAFSKNGKITMYPRDSKYLGLMGHYQELSASDKGKLNAMYCNHTEGK